MSEALHLTEAYKQGISSALDAGGEPKFAKNPHEPGTKDWRAWNMGWDAGVFKLLMKKGDD